MITINGIVNTFKQIDDNEISDYLIVSLARGDDTIFNVMLPSLYFITKRLIIPVLLQFYK